MTLSKGEADRENIATRSLLSIINSDYYDTQQDFSPLPSFNLESAGTRSDLNNMGGNIGAKVNFHGFDSLHGFDLESDSLSITSPYSEMGRSKNDSVIGYRSLTESGSELRSRIETAFQEELAQRVGSGTGSGMGSGTGSIILGKGVVLSEEMLERLKDNVKSRAQIRSVSKHYFVLTFFSD